MADSSRGADFTARFIGTSALLSIAVGFLAWGMVYAFPPMIMPGVRYPPTFVASTLTLLWGSVALSRAVQSVRRERQSQFRRQLLMALGQGSLFVALQISSLNWLIRQFPAEQAATGDQALIAVFAALHAMHFATALLFVLYVVLQAWRDRYDHEYYWDVSVCAWLWHALGLVWLAMLAVMLVTSVVEGPASHDRKDTAPSFARAALDRTATSLTPWPIPPSTAGDAFSLPAAT